MIKLMRKLIAAEKWLIDKCLNKDTVEYEDCYYAIEKHKKEIERIAKECKL